MLEPDKIFIGGLNYSTDEARLIEWFSQYGHVINVRIIKDHVTKKSKGFAFVTFADEESASRALVMNDQELDGRSIGVNIAFRKQR